MKLDFSNFLIILYYQMMKKSKRNSSMTKRKQDSKLQIQSKQEIALQTPPLKTKRPKLSKPTHQKDLNRVSLSKKSTQTHTKNPSKSILFEKPIQQDNKYSDEPTNTQCHNTLRQYFKIGISKQNKVVAPHNLSTRSEKFTLNPNKQILKNSQKSMDPFTKRDEQSLIETQNQQFTQLKVKRQDLMMDLERSRENPVKQQCQSSVGQLKIEQKLLKEQISGLQKQNSILREKVVKIEKSVENLKNWTKQREQFLIDEFKIQKQSLRSIIERLRSQQGDLNHKNKILQNKLENNEQELVSLTNNRSFLEQKIIKYESNAVSMRKENKQSKLRIQELQSQAKSLKINMVEFTELQAEYEEKLITLEIQKRQIKVNAQEVLKILRDYQAGEDD